MSTIIEIDEVNEAIVINEKNARDTNIPPAPIVSKRLGKTETIRPGPAINSPLESNISTPLESATYIAGNISNPAITAIPISSKATSPPSAGRFSLLLM